ncbi:hypothetical protein LSH36_397g02037 [Paralvinella palmiformis]|uniref:Peptidase S1 domain-containing protein n=1 Tax=Paralvinella palmiformis TaxID=53620 RepID=A0AAD9JD24_9ANNE|nr:hypothetical protein LSH36_397g02037 [Paralvinella palmiformis]
MRPLVVLVTLIFITSSADSKGHSRVRRVIGGEEFNAGKWPWLVSLQGRIPDLTFFGIPLSWKTYYCGASIINDRWIMTAAHCFQEINLG